mgnify:CR=1 FL=1
MNSLEINILDYSANTISISYEHTNPKYAQDICNTITKVYLNYDLYKKATSSINIVEFINAQKDSVDVRLKSSEKEIQEFKKNNNVNVSDVGNSINTFQLDEIDKKIIEFKMEISMMERFTEKFNSTLSTEINSNTINSLSLSKIFYDDELIISMISKIKELLRWIIFIPAPFIAGPLLSAILSIPIFIIFANADENLVDVPGKLILTSIMWLSIYWFGALLKPRNLSFKSFRIIWIISITLAVISFLKANPYDLRLQFLEVFIPIYF